MYILCMERRKCQAEREKTDRFSRRKVNIYIIIQIKYLKTNFLTGRTFR